MSRHNTTASSSGPGSGAAKPKPRKFCTRGEEFFDFLKALGYEPPKHQQAEHFEYLFQDEKSEKFARKLMSTLKTDNCLLPEEIERYEDLKKQDMVLYGADLEEAVERRKAIDQMYSQQQQKRLMKKQEMEDMLATQVEECEKLSKYRDGVFMREVADWQIKQAKVASVLTVVHGLISSYEKEIEIDEQLLSEKMEELESTVLELRKNLNPTESSGDYLCQIDISGILEREDRLFEKVQEMICKHGTKLIMKDAGYLIEGDPLNEESMRKIFVQFEKDFDRLKHSIIYERTRQISLELNLAGEKGCLESFDDCYKKAYQLNLLDPDTRAKVQMENRDNINDLTIALERETEDLENHTRELALLAVNQQFSAITNIKARAQKKSHYFFSLMTSVLKEQKIRLSLIRNLVKSEAKIYERLVSNIEENIAVSTAHSKKLEQKTKEPSGLSEEGHLLTLIMSQLGIGNSWETIQSLSNVHLVVNRIKAEMEESYWNSIQDSRVQCNNAEKNLDKTVQVLKDVVKSTFDTEKGGAMQKLIAEKEEALNKQKEELKMLQLATQGKAKGQDKPQASVDQRLRDLLEDGL